MTKSFRGVREGDRWNDQVHYTIEKIISTKVQNPTNATVPPTLPIWEGVCTVITRSTLQTSPRRRAHGVVQRVYHVAVMLAESNRALLSLDCATKESKIIGRIQRIVKTIQTNLIPALYEINCARINERK